MPAPLVSKPELPAHLTFYWRCFCDLSGDRPQNMGGASAIPFRSIDAWARRYQVEGDAFERLATLLGAMDAAWLDEQSRINGRSP